MFGIEKNTQVKAVAPGKVLYIGAIRGMQNIVVVGHGKDFISYYGHLDELAVVLGDVVSSGQSLGTIFVSNEQDSRLHFFSIRRKNSPLDPLKWLSYRY